jgi:ketosteroid isomerase-like protein
MSREREALARAVYDGLARGDFDPLFGLLAEDAEYVNPDLAMEPGTRRGRPEFEAAVRRIFDAFDVSRFDVERLVVVGDTWAAVLDVEGHGRASEAPIRRRFGHLVSLRGGQIVRLEWFLDPDLALQAVRAPE